MVLVGDYRYLQLLIFQTFALKTVLIDAVNISDCVSDNNVQDFPAEETDCCDQDEWLVNTRPGQYRFVEILTFPLQIKHQF